MVQIFCGYTGLFNFLACFFLAIFLFLKNSKDNKNKTFALWSFSVSVWSLGYFIWLFVDRYEAALFWSRFLMAGAIVIPTAYFHFALIFLGLEKEKKYLVRFCYIFSICYLILNITPLFIKSVEPRFWFKWWPVPGPLYHLYQLYFSLIVVYSHILIFKKAKSAATETVRKQLTIVGWGTLIAYTGGSTNFFLWYNIPIPPVFNFLVSGYVFFIAYAILHYKLWDIQLFVRKTLVFAGLLGFVFTIFSAATFFVQEALSRFGFGKIWTYGISLFLIVLGYDPIRNYLINFTDKFLFQKKYNYQELLKDASRGMSKIESLHRLLGLVVHFITMRMRVKNAAIMMRRRDNEFELGYQRGYQKNFLEYRLDDTNPMIMYLKREKEAIDIEHVREFMELGNKKLVKGEKPREYDFHAILLTMQELSCACVIPSFLGHELQNILLIGEKKSGDYYTTEDMNLLFTLAQESAIAIENAKLFDEALRKSSQLEKINEQLEYSRNLLMKALRETEVANKQLQDTQAQLIHEQKMATLGRLAASVGHEVNNPLTILSMNVSRAILKYRKNPDLRVGEVLDLFQKMEQNIGRIKAVVNTLTGLLKRSEKGKFEPLSLKLILEETLPLVQFQTYLDNLTGTEVDFDISGSVPLIRGDLERLQEVFLNLFINAYHAMMGKRNRRIRVTAEMDTENPHNVAVHFTDNGCGMTDEVMKKIFNYGFTTKPPGRGSGMGLYMCKYIIELHGGDIRVRSKVGEGTTFTITLPAYEEGLGESGGSMRIEATS